jgi:hypothetical protein
MPLSDWIERYPQVKALLQGEGEALLYGVEPAQEDTPTREHGPHEVDGSEGRTRIQARLAQIEADATERAIKRALAVAMAREIRRRFQPRDEDTHA